LFSLPTLVLTCDSEDIDWDCNLNAIIIIALLVLYVRGISVSRETQQKGETTYPLAIIIAADSLLAAVVTEDGAEGAAEGEEAEAAVAAEGCLRRGA
jgi:hypothetical protein